MPTPHTRFHSTVEELKRQVIMRNNGVASLRSDPSKYSSQDLNSRSLRTRGLGKTTRRYYC